MDWDEKIASKQLQVRSGDDVAVSLLLQHRANPAGREYGNNDPIFVAIQMNSAENVHRLLQYSRRERGMMADADFCDDALRWRLPHLFPDVDK